MQKDDKTIFSIKSHWRIQWHPAPNSLDSEINLKISRTNRKHIKIKQKNPRVRLGDGLCI